MADPITMMAGVSMATTLAGGITGAIGAEGQGESQAAAYQYKAGVARLNKQINDQNAIWARQSGDIQAMESGLRSGQAIGQTKANQGASGIDVNSGTNVAVQDSQMKAAAFDQDVIRFDAAKAAYGYETRGMGDMAEAQLDEMSGRNARTAGKVGAVTSILGAASSVASKWTQSQTIGMGSGGGGVGVWNGENFGSPAGYREI